MLDHYLVNISNCFFFFEDELYLFDMSIKDGFYLFSGLNTESYGELIIKLQSLSRGAENLGLQWGQQDNKKK